MKKLITLLTVLILLTVLFGGCASVPEVIVQQGEEFTPPPEAAPEDTDDLFLDPDDYVALGNQLAESENVNGVYLGMGREELFQIVGNADNPDEVANHSDTDTRYRVTYNHEKIESYFEFMSDSEDMNGAKLIYAGFGKTYTGRTSRGIGIGSTKDEVIEAYQNEYNILQSGKKQNNEILIMGDELAGIHFYLDTNTNTVSSFILKSATAE